MLALMRSLKYVDPWLIECDFLHSYPPYITSFMFLNLRSVSEFLPKLSNNKKSWWNQISLMLNILSKALIKRREVLDEKKLKCIKFSGAITQKEKPHGKLKATPIKTSLVFSILSKVPHFPHLVICPNLGMRFFLRG